MRSGRRGRGHDRHLRSGGLDAGLPAVPAPPLPAAGPAVLPHEVEPGIGHAVVLQILQQLVAVTADQVQRFKPFGNDAEAASVIGSKQNGHAAKLDGIKPDLDDAVIPRAHDGVGQLPMGGRGLRLKGRWGCLGRRAVLRRGGPCGGQFAAARGMDRHRQLSGGQEGGLRA